MLRFLDHCNPWLVSLGVGLLPWAPGTWGSFLGLFLMVLFWPSLALGSMIFALLAVVWFFLVHRYLLKTGNHDPKEVIVDEVLGQWVTLFPLLGGDRPWGWIVFGFLLFRGLDIVKPNPIGWVDRKAPGVWGVMGDDLLAGVLGALIIGLGVLWFG